MLKILYIANVRFPSERAHSAQIAHNCQAFAYWGHQITLVTGNRQKAIASDIEEVFGFEPYFKLRQLRFGLVFVPYSKVAFIFNNLLFSIGVTTTCGLGKHDFIYFRDEWIGYFLSFFVRRDKLVWESHEAKFNWPAQRLLRKGVKTVCISEGIREFYLSNTVPNEQLLVADDGIDNSFLGVLVGKDETRKSLGLDQDAFLVGYIGGFDAWKGVDTFFVASEKAPEGIKFVAIGGKEVELPQYRARYPKVNFLGPRAYEELAKNQQAFDVLVIPNTAKNDLSAKYTSPLKLFAHMASGVPIVASDIPSIVTITGRELVTLVTPDNPEALARAIIEVKAGYAEKVQKAAQLRTVASGYTWEARAKKILTFLGSKDRSV